MRRIVDAGRSEQRHHCIGDLPDRPRVSRHRSADGADAPTLNLAHPPATKRWRRSVLRVLVLLPAHRGCLRPFRSSVPVHRADCSRRRKVGGLRWARHVLVSAKVRYRNASIWAVVGCPIIDREIQMMTTWTIVKERAVLDVMGRPTSQKMARARLRRAYVVVGALVLAVAAGGCASASTKTTNSTIARVASTTVDVAKTSSDAGAGPSTDASACRLASEADVSTAMKQPMKVAGGGGSSDGICEFAATADPSVLLAVQTFAKLADASLYTGIEPSSDHVDGLGDNAFWNSTLGMVFVVKGDRGFAVTSPSLGNLTGDPQASKAAMVGLAKIVLGKF